MSNSFSIDNSLDLVESAIIKLYKKYVVLIMLRKVKVSSTLSC